MDTTEAVEEDDSRWARFMKRFEIDGENHVIARLSKSGARRKNSRMFGSQREFARLTEKFGAARLVEIWNKLPNVEPLRRFPNRESAIEKIWKAIQQIDVAETARPVRDKTAEKGLTNTVPCGPAVSKTNQIIALIGRGSGATLNELMEATNWQRHSLRGFICRLPQRFGLRIKSFKRGGEQAYRIRKGKN